MVGEEEGLVLLEVTTVPLSLEVPELQSGEASWLPCQHHTCTIPTSGTAGASSSCTAPTFSLSLGLGPNALDVLPQHRGHLWVRGLL